MLSWGEIVLDAVQWELHSAFNKVITVVLHESLA